MRRTTYTKRTGIGNGNGWSRKRLITSSVAVVIIAGVIAGLELSDVTHFFHTPPTPPVIPSTTPSGQTTRKTDNSAGKSNKDQNSMPATDKTTSKNSAPNATSLPLYAPYGDFVSNHHPGANGSPTSETSVCNTTPGAVCYISFSNGITTTKLPAQKTNSSGVTYWYWDVDKAHLAAGNWQVTAIATLNGQTKKTKDPQPLTIE